MKASPGDAGVLDDTHIIYPTQICPSQFLLYQFFRRLILQLLTRLISFPLFDSIENMTVSERCCGGIRDWLSFRFDG